MSTREHSRKNPLLKTLSALVTALGLLAGVVYTPPFAQAQTSYCASGCSVGNGLTATYSASTNTTTVTGVGTLNKDLWLKVAKPTSRVVFAGAPDSRISLPADSSMLFMNFSQQIILPDNLDTSQVVNMNSMFYGAEKANPDVSGWDTSNVTSMDSMFALTDVADPDVSRWNTSRVTNMNRMFNSAQAANPDVSAWDVHQVTDTSYMFNHTAVADPDISRWEYRSLLVADSMFCNAQKATRWRSTSLGKQLNECGNGNNKIRYVDQASDKRSNTPIIVGSVIAVAVVLAALGAALQLGLLPLLLAV